MATTTDPHRHDVEVQDHGSYALIFCKARDCHFGDVIDTVENAYAAARKHANEAKGA